MRVGDKRCMVCSCDGTMNIEGAKLAQILDPQGTLEVAHSLCRHQLPTAQQVMADEKKLIIACEQEAALFSQIADENHCDLQFVDIRDRAGWSADSSAKTPKMAALLAAGALSKPAVTTLEIQSQGHCLVIGSGQIALDAATRLAKRLNVTLFLANSEQVTLPVHNEIVIFVGKIRSIRGHLGAFHASAEHVAQVRPSSRAEINLDALHPEIELPFDIILDLGGGSPMVPAHNKRDGYLRADPGDPLAVERLLFDATDLIGVFEKPRYIDYSADICAHSRSKKTGCTRCLDACPTGAITSDGDHVAMDPFICAGCGSCAALCPTGAATYAAPQPNGLIDELRVLLTTFRQAGGTFPSILAYETEHGGPLLSMWARHGEGLPANVIPWRMTTVAQLGLDAILASIAYGASQLTILAPKAKLQELVGTEAIIAHANDILSGLGYGDDRVELVVENDPEAVFGKVGIETLPIDTNADYLPLGGKRERIRLALDHLHATAPTPRDTIQLPEGAPLGSISVDVEGCTLCLACVGACPTGALIDNPDRPMLRFLEDACVQCGLCRSTCPEKVITLDPRVNFTAAAKSPRTLNEEEPFECIRCGKAFGARSTIERIVGQLALKHSMFQSNEQVERLKMCEDCRVVVQFEAKDNPFTGGPKARTKTTEDYLKEREEIKEARRRHQDKDSS